MNKDKKIVSYSINKELLKDFSIIAERKHINRSSLIESFIEDWVEQNQLSLVNLGEK